jgi:IclR family acetate operon transcriptional repressor
MDAFPATEADPQASDETSSTPERKLNATAKVLRVLEVVSEPPGPHRLNTLVTRSGLAKTSVHRLLGELVESGYVERDALGRYRPARHLSVLAAKVMSGSMSNDVHSILTELQQEVGNTVHFALKTGHHAVYVDKVEGDEQPLHMASRPGMELALHATAIGKAILAYGPEADLRDYARRTGLPPVTANTLTSLPELIADGEHVRDRGYAIDNQENEPLIRCIAAPVFDQQHEPVGAVSISTVVALVDAEQLLSFAPQLIATAARVQIALT